MRIVRLNEIEWNAVGGCPLRGLDIYFDVKTVYFGKLKRNTVVTVFSESRIHSTIGVDLEVDVSVRMNGVKVSKEFYTTVLVNGVEMLCMHPCRFCLGCDKPHAKSDVIIADISVNGCVVVVFPPRL